jgi:hypothetical protein
MTWNVGTKVSARRTALGRAVGIVAAAGLMISGLSGCGEPTYSPPTLYPVKGQILLSDGKPLTSGHVVLVSNHRVEFPGKVGSDGRFSIKSGAGDGAPEGEYKAGLTHHNSEAGLYGKFRIPNKLKLLPYSLATFR